MQVELINYTGAGSNDPANWAASVLIYTKQTRLEMTPGLFEEILSWPGDRKEQELQYMARTLPSSWEFVDLHFLVSGVTRAFTHQMVRTRTASYAQQAQRVVKMKQFGYIAGPSLDTPEKEAIYHSVMRIIQHGYDDLISKGTLTQDARGILPTNILTNINVKLNFRAFVDLARKRSSPRVQDEYRQVIELMKSKVLEVYPWAGIFLNRTRDKVALELSVELANMEDKELATRLIKLVDQLREE